MKRTACFLLSLMMLASIPGAPAEGVLPVSDSAYIESVLNLANNPDQAWTYNADDGAWGCVAYSAITSLYEADAAQAFEYYMDTTYEFNTPFQRQLAAYLSAAYMEYINGQNMTVDEAKIGFDLSGDGDTDDTVALTIQCDPDACPETNGYHGTYLELYRLAFRENLRWYLDNLSYADGWMWFDEDGHAVTDMTADEKALAFIQGRYARGGDGMTGRGGMPGSEGPSGMMGGPGGNPPDGLPGGPGTAAEPNGTDLSAWVDASDIGSVDFTLADVLAYRNAGATKAVPGFDVIDHGQENYVFGSETEDARHWNVFLNDIFQDEACAAVLRDLFNAGGQ